MIIFWYLIIVVQIYMIAMGDIRHTSNASFFNPINESELDSSVGLDQIYKCIKSRPNV